MTRLQRRATVLIAGMLSVTLALAGCGSDEVEAPHDGSASTLPAAEGSTDYPLAVQTWAGESTVEERPERIAVIGFSTNLDFLQALDVTPVYTLTEDADYDWRDTEWFSNIEVVDATTRRDPTNFEGLAAANPDLIISLNSVVDESEFDRLTDIAPVLEYEEQLGDQGDWRDGQRLVGQVLDLSEAAESAIEEADEDIATTAAEHPEFTGRTITIAADYADSSTTQRPEAPPRAS